MKEALITVGVVAYLVSGVMFWALFSVAHDADKQQEPVYDEDSKKHSGLLTEED